MYNLNGVNISSVTSVKDLGIQVSNDLSWRLHCTEVTKRANKVANVILHSFSAHCIDVYMKAFEVYVMPILEYCCCLWSPVNVKDMTMIENVLRTFTRRAFYKCGIAGLSFPEMLKYVKHECVAYKHLLLSLVMFFNIFKKYVVCSVLDNVTVTSLMHSINLRRPNHHLFLLYCRTNLRQMFFTNKIMPIWNFLPSTCVNTILSKTFTNNIRHVNLSNYYRAS